MRRALPASLLVVGLTVTGCSLSTPQVAASPSGGATTSTSSGTTTTAAVSQLTGTQLKAMLAPAAWFPSGYSLSKDGSANTSDQDLPAPAKQNPPCSSTRRRSTRTPAPPRSRP